MTRSRTTPDIADAPKTHRIAVVAKWLTGVAALASLSGVVIALRRYATLSAAWPFQAAVFVLVATLPQFFIDRVAEAAETVADNELNERVIKRGFENLGAWVGVIERPLLLGALVGGFPEFLAGWYVLKGIAGYRLGFNKREVAERRAFQLFLINNGMSFAGVAAGWLLWILLRFPTRGH